MASHVFASTHARRGCGSGTTLCKLSILLRVRLRGRCRTLLAALLASSCLLLRLRLCLCLRGELAVAPSNVHLHVEVHEQREQRVGQHLGPGDNAGSASALAAVMIDERPRRNQARVLQRVNDPSQDSRRQTFSAQPQHAQSSAVPCDGSHGTKNKLHDLALRDQRAPPWAVAHEARAVVVVVHEHVHAACAVTAWGSQASNSTARPHTQHTYSSR